MPMGNGMPIALCTRWRRPCRGGRVTKINKKWRRYILLLVASLCLTAQPLAADDPVIIDPNHPSILTLKWLQQITDIGSPFTWLIGGLLVTFKSYSMLRNEINEVRALRTAALKELKTLQLTRKQSQAAEYALNQAFAEWDRIEAQASWAITDLDIEYQKFLKVPKQRRKKWLESEEGTEWARRFEEMNRLLQVDLDGAYRSVVEHAQALFPEEYAHVSRSRPRPHLSHRDMAAPSELDQHYNRLDAMSSHVVSLRVRCRDSIASFDNNLKNASTNLKIRNYIGWRTLIGTAGTVGGMSGFWYSMYTFQHRYGKNPLQLSAEASKRNQTNLQAEIDLCGQVASNGGQKKLAATREIIRAVLTKNFENMETALRDRVTTADLNHLSQMGYTVDDLVRFLHEPGHIDLAFQRALCVAGKKQIGERTTVDQVLNYLYPVDIAVKDIERPRLVHDFYVQFFNSIWSPLAPTGGGANRITNDVMTTLEVETIQRLDAKKVTPPPPAAPLPGLQNEAGALKPASSHPINPISAVSNIDKSYSGLAFNPLPSSAASE